MVKFTSYKFQKDSVYKSPYILLKCHTVVNLTFAINEATKKIIQRRKTLTTVFKSLSKGIE